MTPERDVEFDVTLRIVKTTICQACIDGKGHECHTPGCVMFLHRVDIPLQTAFIEYLDAALSQGRATEGDDVLAKAMELVGAGISNFHMGREGSPGQAQSAMEHWEGRLEAFKSALATLQAERDAAVAQERERCARIAGERADNAYRIASRWTPGTDGNDRTIAHWEARNREALDIASAIRAAALKGDAKPATEEK